MDHYFEVGMFRLQDLKKNGKMRNLNIMSKFKLVNKMENALNFFHIIFYLDTLLTKKPLLINSVQPLKYNGQT